MDPGIHTFTVISKWREMGPKLTASTHEFGLPQEASRATPRICRAHPLKLDDSIEAIEYRSHGLLEMYRAQGAASISR